MNSSTVCHNSYNARLAFFLSFITSLQSLLIDKHFENIMQATTFAFKILNLQEMHWRVKNIHVTQDFFI